MTNIHDVFAWKQKNTICLVKRSQKKVKNIELEWLIVSKQKIVFKKWSNFSSKVIYYKIKQIAVNADNQKWCPEGIPSSKDEKAEAKKASQKDTKEI